MQQPVSILCGKDYNSVLLQILHLEIVQRFLMLLVMYIEIIIFKLSDPFFVSYLFWRMFAANFQQQMVHFCCSFFWNKVMKQNFPTIFPTKIHILNEEKELFFYILSKCHILIIECCSQTFQIQSIACKH